LSAHARKKREDEEGRFVAAFKSTRDEKRTHPSLPSTSSLLFDLERPRKETRTPTLKREFVAGPFNVE